MVQASIVIPTYNNADSLGLTLDTLALQDFTPENYEIIIVDNGSTDHTKTIANTKIIEYPDNIINYHFEPEPGSLAARHRGVLESFGEILVFIDDDIDADRGWLKAVMKTFEDATIQIVGGKNLIKYEISPPDWLDYFYKTQYGGYMCVYLSLVDFGKELIDIDPKYIWTLNFSIRREIFYDLRGFHPNIYPNHLQHYQGDGEDGLTLKAHNQGYRSVYQPKAIVYHRIPASRLTIEYFERRAFFQGVSASFIQIRALNKKGYTTSKIKKYSCTKRFINTLKQPLLHIRNNYKHILGKKTDNSEILKMRARIWNARYFGFKFHQTAVKSSPDLLAWVLKSDYWDYRLPTIKPPKTKIGIKYRRNYTYYCR